MVLSGLVWTVTGLGKKQRQKRKRRAFGQYGDCEEDDSGDINGDPSPPGKGFPGTAAPPFFCTVEVTRQFGVFILVFDQSSIHCALCMYVCVRVSVNLTVCVRVREKG
ncbi:hypothetical protein FQA47_007212 [Oryzias melastigma]|uniref:Uncharacterized protein n=1 Tax=Oryzias melastigma TaxID=30732 RepID=A0A834EZT1_ORYME|nr:hypothetical protein FQA47_007212 [Oryzias melastigma]